MKLSQAIDLFLTGIRADGRSVHTIRWYRQCVSRLAAFLDDPDLSQVSADDLRRFLVALRSQNVRYRDCKYRKPVEGGFSPFTIQGYVRSIKRLYGWLVENDYLTSAQNVASKLKRQSLPKSVPKEISEEDFRALITATHQSPFPKRDYALLLFLADTGCRVGGLVGLRLFDIDLDSARVVLMEKGRKSRVAFLSAQTVMALREWLAVRQASSEFVFVGRRGNQLTIWGVRQVLERLALLAGIKGRFNPHSFRHRFAKRFLMDGGDLASLSRLMGHSDVSVTSNFYAVFLLDELQKKHNQHSPLSGIV